MGKEAETPVATCPTEDLPQGPHCKEGSLFRAVHRGRVGWVQRGTWGLGRGNSKVSVQPGKGGDSRDGAESQARKLLLCLTSVSSPLLILYSSHPQRWDFTLSPPRGL